MIRDLRQMTEFDSRTAEECHKSMMLIRCVEELIANNYHPDDRVEEMRCPIHLSIGQEASAVGVIQHLSNDDKVFSTHRCHAHYLAKGGSIEKMLGELLGREGGSLGGRGGSMHLKDSDVNFVMSVPIVGSVMPVATGAALANKLDNNHHVVVVFIGDGSLEEGVWHETANFSVLHEIPVLFVCENNLYSVYSRLDERQPSRDLSRFAKAHCMTYLNADGNDVRQVYFQAAEALKIVRGGEPCLINLDTYRHREHCGPNFDDHLGYRPTSEVEEWMLKDPIKISRNILLNDFQFSDGRLKEIEKICASEAEKAMQTALRMPFPDFVDVSSLEYPE